MQMQEKIDDLSFVSLDVKSNIKRVHVNLLAKRSNPKKIRCGRIVAATAPREKVIVGTDLWQFVEDDYTYKTQVDYLEILFNYFCSVDENGYVHDERESDEDETVSEETMKKIEMVKKMIGIKRQGYKQQDVEKKIYDVNKFVSLNQIVKLLMESRLCCFYCEEPVFLYYKMAREPKQWSLERIYNQYGHNYDNVKIACLTCNVRRNTMHHERYLDTKRMRVVVKHSGERSEP